MPFGSSQWMYSSGFYPTVIDQSLMFDGSSYLTRTPSVAGDRRTWTYSSWFKRWSLTPAAGGQSLFYAGDTTLSPRGGIIFGDAGDDKLSINGMLFDSTTAILHATRHPSGDYKFVGYLADTYFVDGTALDPTSFGEFKNGVWIPKRYTGSYGTNGFHLEYDGNANDSSGTGNNWTATNIVAGDYMLDSPTNNYATLNPLAPSGGTFSNGNLSWSSATTDGRFALSTISPSTDGKWYCEVNIGSKASTYWTVGLFAYPATALPRILYRSDGPIYLDGSEVATVSSFTQNDVIGMAYDGSTRSLTLYKNNTSLGSWTASSTTINYFFGCASDSSGSSANYTLNFGQSGFTYTPPAGFLALSTANLPEPSISPLYGASPQDHFNTVLYTGNGAALQALLVLDSSLIFWVKSQETYRHQLGSIMMVREAGLNYLVKCNDDEESTEQTN
jgi:hypothetical protein